MRASSELQWGAFWEVWRHVRDREHCRENLVALYRVGTHQIRRRRRIAPSWTSQGTAETLYTRIKARTGRFLGEKLMSDLDLFCFYVSRQGAKNGQYSWVFLKHAQGFGWLNADSRADFTSSRSPPPWTSIFPFSVFMYDVWP